MKRMHWGAYKRLRDRWALEMRGQRGAMHKAVEKCTVHIKRYHVGGGIRDIDNMYSSAKVPLDALVIAGWIADDDMDHVTGLTVVQERVPHRTEQRTEITIQEVE
jgi:Holliday junction resolvase RusA-like endonuclease